MVKGIVIDAKTKMPLSGAAVGIQWTHYKIGPPGLPTPKDIIDTAQRLTDSRGSFEVPKYYGLGRSYDMGIYKEGYICWSSYEIFNPEGETYEAMYKERAKYPLNDGMIIELQPIEGPIPLFEHANFIGVVGTRVTLGSKFGPFDQAIQPEKERFRRMQRQRKKNREK
ncbi:MAG: hypothetical protein JEZ12_13650 [Desulfobacterium sp.]|nr:hypothetical protein [Desulfobacterium sp.]